MIMHDLGMIKAYNSRNNRFIDNAEIINKPVSEAELLKFIKTVFTDLEKIGYRMDY